MGVVYLAERDDDAFERRVALKLIRGGPGSSEIVRRFLQERQILARLDHPGIARLLDGGSTADGRPYLVMEHVEGEPIDAFCRTRGSTVGERLELVVAICSAVDYAHRNLVVHRDLKPGNVLVAADATPKLLDFGIAKLLHSDLSGQTVAPTRAGLRVMTPDYASPEQMRGEAITTATDVYSLGVMLYELVAGRPPYELGGRALPEIARVICEHQPPPPSTAERGEPPAAAGGGRFPHRRLHSDLDAIVLKALRKEPEQRYASAEQLAADLRRHLDGLPVLARQGSLGYRASKFVRRHRLGVAAAAGFAMLLALFVTSMALQVARTSRALERAEGEAAKAAAVQAFLTETLDAADPESNDGRQLTVQEALDRARQRLASSFAEQPEIAAAVQLQVGRLYSNLGRYDDAEPLVRQALATRRSLLPAVHADLAEALEDLGLLLGRSGRAAESEPLFREALAIRRELGGPGAPEVAENLDRMASVAFAAGDPRRAAELERAAVDVHRQGSGDREAQLVHALSSLAGFERESGDLAAAEAALREASDVLDRLHDPPLKTRGEVEMQLGTLLEAQGRYEEAELPLRKNLATQRQLFGDEHHWVALGLVRLGTVLTRQGRHDDAEGPLREGVAMLQRVLTADHPDLTAARNNLALLLGERGDLAEAAELLREVSEVQRRVMPGHPFLGVTLRNLGLVEMRLASHRDARRHFDEALAIHRHHHGEDHPRTALSLLALAWAVGELGDWQEAAASMRRAHTALAATHPPGHPRIAEADALLALALTRLGRFDEAEERLTLALPVLRQAHGPHNHRVRRALETLVELHEARGEPDAAARYRAQLPHSSSTVATISKAPGRRPR
jgi:serine/threonine-protein kinase